MKGAYRIRLAREDEIPGLRDIERAAAVLFESYGISDVFGDVLTDREDFEVGYREQRLWVAIEAQVDGPPIGFALADVVGENAHLDELDVHPDHGRRGVGRDLVETFLDWARREGHPAATLTTLRHVPWNAPFYESLGFRVLEPRELTPVLRALLREEILRGLPSENRVAMYCPLG